MIIMWIRRKESGGPYKASPGMWWFKRRCTVRTLNSTLAKLTTTAGMWDLLIHHSVLYFSSQSGFERLLPRRLPVPAAPLALERPLEQTKQSEEISIRSLEKLIKIVAPRARGSSRAGSRYHLAKA